MDMVVYIILTVHKNFSNTKTLAFEFGEQTSVETGVCELYSAVDKVSYYTCPDGAESEGSNASCYGKLSEMKGWSAKESTENLRCLKSGQNLEVPAYEKFDFSAEAAKQKAYKYE